MKRMTFLLLAVLLSVEPLTAQTPAADSVRRIDPMPGDEVQLVETGRNGALQLQAGGFGLTLGRSYESRVWEQYRRQRFSLDFLTDAQLGFTMLTGVKYARPDADYPDFLDQSIANSIHVSVVPVAISCHLGKRRHSAFSLGLQYGVDNLRLSNPALSVQNAGGALVPVELEPVARKSKLRYTTLGPVLTFSHFTASQFSFQLSGYCEFLMHGRVVTKSPKQKPLLPGFSPWRFGAGIELGYSFVGVFARYSPTSLFKASTGIEAQTLSYGIACNFSF